MACGEGVQKGRERGNRAHKKHKGCSRKEGREQASPPPFSLTRSLVPKFHLFITKIKYNAKVSFRFMVRIKSE